ncbi:MAG: twin-arginine translocase subunit TatC [Chloroflexi bacterium]|nr:twin-arginine translocase subunit TatC [Chloroflexota bacterium]
MALPPPEHPLPADQAAGYPVGESPSPFRAWAQNGAGAAPSGEDEDEAGAALTEHLEELRARIIKALIAVAVGTVAGAFLAFPVLELLKSRVEGVELIRTQVTEMLTTYMKISVVLGIIFAMPVILYQGIMFVVPGLTRQERRFLFIMLPAAVLSFLIGAAFAFFVLLPPALYFLVHFGEEFVKPLIRVGDYVSVITSLVFWVGVAFETPVVIFLLARVGAVTPQRLVAYRRYAVVGAFLLGAIITPTFDPINQTLVALPLIALYEFGILLARLAVRQRAKALSA